MNWNKPLQFFQKHGFTRKFVSDMYDGFTTILMKKPCFDLFKFDDYLHHWKGNYEEQGKSLNDIFAEIFGDDVEIAKEYFCLT